MNKTYDVKDREEFYGYSFNKHYRQLAGLKSSYYFCRENKVLPTRIKVNKYYADELKFLDRAIHEVAVDMERDQLRDEMRTLYEKFGRKPYPRSIRNDDTEEDKAS